MKKEVRSWLRMMAVGDDYPIPSSEAVYTAHSDQIDVVLPLHGGGLCADGSWEQEPWKYKSLFGQSLPGLAAAAGRLYLPTVDCKRTEVLAVLDDPALQQLAADNLVVLATVGRFDSPWNGVDLNFEGIPSDYQDRLSAFFYRLSCALHLAGLTVSVSARGRTADSGEDYDDAYTTDFAVIAQIADVLNLYCYGFWSPVSGWLQRSIAPYWWIKDSIEYAIDKGTPHERIILGCGTFCRYFPNSSSGSGRVEITYQQALDLTGQSNTFQRWIECDSNGLVRERQADLGVGHIWIHDGDTIRHSLDLVDEFGLAGIALFSPGCGDAYHWQVIENWRTGHGGT